MEPTGINRPEKKDVSESNGKHSSACTICKRPLTNFLSVKLGTGPVCRAGENTQPGLPFENHAEFEVRTVNDKFIYLEDIGHMQFKTVTADVEAVLRSLKEDYNIRQLRIFYKDSEGEIDEIIHKDGQFKNFRHGHNGFNLAEVLRHTPLEKPKKKRFPSYDEFGR